MQPVEETPEKDVTHDESKSADGPMTRGRTGKCLIQVDIVMDAEDAQDAAPIPATDGDESQDSDEMPELESIPDDENSFIVSELFKFLSFSEEKIRISLRIDSIIFNRV